MDTVTAHSTTNSVNPTAPSYVDAYLPPLNSNPIASAPVQNTWSQPAQVDTMPEYTPPLAEVSPTVTIDRTPDAPTVPASSSEELEDQNIFFMLGVSDGSAEQREAFLDELQQVIWEDFLEFDVKLLITRDEQEVLNKMLAEEESKDLEKQEKIVVYLEKLVPDLEEIMLEKALELKEEMARERVKGMREFYSDNPETITQLDTAEELMNVGKWHATATLLNSIR